MELLDQLEAENPENPALAPKVCYNNRCAAHTNPRKQASHTRHLVIRQHFLPAV